MPTRNYSFQASRSNSDLVALKDLGNAKNVFDEDFSADMDMKDWNDWMQTEGNVVQLDSPIIDKRESIASTVSWLENTSANVGNISKDAMFAPFLNNNEFSFEDALLEFDEVPPPLYNGLPNSNLSSSSTDTIQTPTEAPRTFRGFSSLTTEEERTLTDIAMPYHILSSTAQIKDSPEPSTPEHSYSPSVPSPSPEPPTRTRKNKKRKSVVDDLELRSALCQSRKTGHNAIEKRYRTNLNEKIDCLRQSVPAFPRRSSNSEDNDGEEEDEDMDGEDSKIGRQKYGKAAILTRALEYIKHLENTTQRLGSEVDLLKNRVGAFEKLAMNGSMALGDRVGLVASGILVVKSETLESIRADFKQVGPKYRPLPGPNTRRRNSRQAAKAELDL
ncbi:hypothetical protein BDZ45DRAFT_802031 [Acephala macrosclerotiorum]|nr:hypothetical protein BDZ45DRAFT_802031 [Acephala macrosclerotiorum]